ncbi:MAG TPA: ferrochelatase [Planctomycetes bacterium]|nr:ferrochelatase [Fuerstiella sp.]HIK94557.1 ferrochelatase [Planctomycetota bacterium]
MPNDVRPPYDALLFVSFGGPEGPDDVIPFLENVLRGKNVPPARMLEVAEHYNHFGGVSPINEQCRQLITALTVELHDHDIDLPIYWGNRNWKPLLPETMRELKQVGATRVLSFVTSAYSGYSGCRQYLENISAAQDEADATEVEVHKLRVFYNHPDFIEVNAQNVQSAICELNAGPDEDFHVAFTAHSIPNSMADTSDYVQQLTESCRLIAERLQLPADRWKLVYQSRSGRPQDPWLEPDICDYLRELRNGGVERVVVSPVGFLSDHIEVLYDLDDEAKSVCEEIGVQMTRAATPDTHPVFVQMIRKLIQERLHETTQECIGRFAPSHDICPSDCCPAPRQPTGRRP